MKLFISLLIILHLWLHLHSFLSRLRFQSFDVKNQERKVRRNGLAVMKKTMLYLLCRIAFRKSWTFHSIFILHYYYALMLYQLDIN